MKTEPPASELPLGGELATTFPAEMPPAAEPATSKRKASTSEGKQGDETEEQQRKRARGRPRLDTRDETAADRRRTQIRLAQRAYRHRKDNAITNLEDKVKELEKNNADMSREFHKFYDLVLCHGLLDASSEVAIRFRAITDNFLRKSGTALGEAGYISPADERTMAVDGARVPTEPGSASSVAVQSPRKSLSDPIEGVSEDLSLRQETVPSCITSYEVVAQATPDNASFPLYTAMDGAPNLAGFAPASSPFATLPLNNSLSYHELTFGRRLQRRTTERGLFLASMANPPPDRYAAVFGFSLLFESREAIVRRLSNQLSNLVMPFQDRANPPSNPLEAKLQQRIRLTFDYEKEFLNAEETELYLRQRGIIIPQQVEFVDAEVDVNELTDTLPLELTGNVSFSSQSSRYQSQHAPVPGSMAMAMTANPNQTMMPHMTMQTTGTIPANGLLSYMCPPGMENMWRATWTKPKLTISVGVLVEELASRSVCMGMHPGVRIRDINHAIKVAAGLLP